MRDPTRIPEILELLKTVWEQEPDMRLGQLIECAKSKGINREIDTFNVEDEIIQRGLLKLRDE